MLALSTSFVAGCGSDDPPAIADPGPDAGVDGGGVEAGGPVDADSGPQLTGTVKDRAGVPVASAKVEVGAASVFTDPMGKYLLRVPMAGAVTLKVTRTWFTPFEGSVTVAASGSTQHDLTLEEIPLKLDPADAALAQSYAQTFDWTKATISIAIAPRPTRRDFDNAVFFRNPALYKDTSTLPMVTPPALPEIGAEGAKNFSFPVRSGRNQGQEAVELTSIVDSLADTRLPPADTAAFMIWTPMLTWLGEWDQTRAADLNAAAVAIRQQGWGGDVPRPQEIDRVYLDSTSRSLWVEIVFAGFVQLGAGITDNDGDGRREVYAKVTSVHVTAEIIDKLSNEYGQTLFSTYGLSKEVAKSLNELYTSTAAQVERTIGQPFEIPGSGTISYPFVVLRHIGGQKNAILVAP